MNCEICCRRLLLCNTPQSLGCTPTVKCNVSHISYCYWNTEKLKCRNEQMRIVKEKALTTLFCMEMIINHKSHFSWWHEGAHMTVAARWGFKYYLMNQNTWSRPVLWNAAASTLVLSIFCCAEVAAAAGTPCLSASCEDESLTCLHICTVSQTSNHKGWKNGTHRTSYGFSDSSGGSFSLCVCVCVVEMWPSVWRGSEWLTGLSRFIIRVFLGCGWPLDLHPRSQTATTAVKKCETVCFQGKRGWHLNVTVAVSSYKRKPNVD